MNPIWPTWLKVSYVVFCVVATTVLMWMWGGLIRPFTDAGGAWFYENLGAWPLLLVFPLWYLAYRLNSR